MKMTLPHLALRDNNILFHATFNTVLRDFDRIVNNTKLLRVIMACRFMGSKESRQVHYGRLPSSINILQHN